MTRDARRYRFEAVLGRGSYGAVYRATMLGADGFEKAVAIKVVASSIDDAEERLIDEARILGRLHHRAIPAVDGLVRLDGELRALVLEYVDGAELRSFVRHLGVMPPVAAVSGHQVLEDGRVVFWDTSANPDGFLAGESPYGGMHLVAVTTEGTVAPLQPLPQEVVADWRLDPTGTTLAALTDEGRIHVGPVGSDLEHAEVRIPGALALLGVSSDGAIALGMAEGLVVFRDGATRVLLPVDEGTARSAVWLDERWLLVHTEDRLLRVHVPSAEVEPLASYDTVTRQRRELSVSPDGRWLLVDHSRVHGDVWVADVVPAP